MARAHRLSRRSLLKSAAAVAATGPWFISNLRAQSPNGAVRHASFGAGGMARADLDALVSHPNLKLVAVADVDLKRAGSVKEKHPDVKIYQDWRELLDKEEKNLDSVHVSTPDHMHAPMMMSAMQRGLNVYGQKPLTHDVYESRKLAEFATAKGLVTQMGIQIHASVEYRLAVIHVQAGLIGKVKAVHTWSNKQWGDASPRPDKSDPIPEGFDWDKWLGVTAERPFIGDGYYHPGNWRKRLDFGTGTFGDMGCHIFDPVFKALALTAPLTMKSTGAAPNAHNWASDAVVEMTFPQTPHTVGPTFPITWYDGVKLPAEDVTKPILGDLALPDQGSLFIGDAGAMLLPHIAMPVLLPKEKFAGMPQPRMAGVNHWHQFVDAVRGKGKTSAHFGYAGPLTESVLLGGIATHFPNQTLEWDAAGMVFKNNREASRLIRREYRKGWEVPGLS